MHRQTVKALQIVDLDAAVETAAEALGGLGRVLAM
jgi:hypothetical protein